MLTIGEEFREELRNDFLAGEEHTLATESSVQTPGHALSEENRPRVPWDLHQARLSVLLGFFLLVSVCLFLYFLPCLHFLFPLLLVFPFFFDSGQLSGVDFTKLNQCAVELLVQPGLLSLLLRSVLP